MGRQAVTGGQTDKYETSPAARADDQRASRGMRGFTARYLFPLSQAGCRGQPDGIRKVTEADRQAGVYTGKERLSALPSGSRDLYSVESPHPAPTQTRRQWHCTCRSG